VFGIDPTSPLFIGIFMAAVFLAGRRVGAVPSTTTLSLYLTNLLPSPPRITLFACTTVDSEVYRTSDAAFPSRCEN
jgi:hypothetical protein